MSWEQRVEIETGDNVLQGRVKWTIAPYQKDEAMAGWVQLTMDFGHCRWQTGRLTPSEARRIAEELLRAARGAEER